MYTSTARPESSRFSLLRLLLLPSIRLSILCVLVVPRCEFRALTLNITKEHNRFEIENLLHAIEAINFISAFFFAVRKPVRLVFFVPRAHKTA